MKTISLFTVLSLFISGFTYGQDIIHLNNGKLLETKVLEINLELIKYLPFENLEASPKQILKTTVHKVVFEGGNEFVITEKASTREDDNPDQKFTLGSLDKEILADKRHAFYIGLLGTGGLMSVNYEYQLSNKHKVIHPYTKIGFGMSNKGIYIPHGISIGIGSNTHQFEVGLGGVLALKFTRTDMLRVIYGEESKYIPNMLFGYRYSSAKGFFMNVSITPMLSKDRYSLSGSNNEEWGITPWFGFGIGFNF